MFFAEKNSRNNNSQCRHMLNIANRLNAHTFMRRLLLCDTKKAMTNAHTDKTTVNPMLCESNSNTSGFSSRSVPSNMFNRFSVMRSLFLLRCPYIYLI